MTRHRVAIAAGLVLALGFAAAAPVTRAQGPSTLPASLTDQEFWDLSSQLSEPNGYFRSDNLLSNEMGFQWVIPDLVARATAGGVYLGVGPEQNFSYISALKPSMVFITDIRRGNLWTQMMYKALFEMSNDRADFVGRLFTKPRPAGLTVDSTGKEIMDKYWDVTTGDEAAFKKNSQDIVDWLTKKRHIPLPEEDQKGIIDDVYYYFWWYGPSINYNSSSGTGNRGGSMAMYYDLMRVSGHRGEFPCAQGPRGEEPARARRRGLRRAEGPARGREVRARPRRARDGDVSVERRTVSAAGRQVARVLRQRREHAPRRAQHVHTVGQRRRSRRAPVRARLHAG
jgi:hypothetical protein